MLLLLASFVAGVLTVLAPCVLPLLPVIIGGSASGDSRDRVRPLVITASLGISLIAFTVLLKATTLLIDIPPRAITALSGGVIVALGVLALFPDFYAKFSVNSGLDHKSATFLNKGLTSKRKYLAPAMIGAALGPVFSSCSPVYGYILASILPVNFAKAMTYIISYVLGLVGILLLVSIFGQKLVRKLKFTTKPNGWFQRTLAVMFILVGTLVITGGDKKVQTWVGDHTPLDFDSATAKLIPKSGVEPTSKGVFNVEPYAAPELTGLESWINSEPLQLSELRGKVVLIDFWTYSCINCIRSIPYVNDWYEEYKDSGFEVIGVHAPEFSFERVRKNVEDAVVDQQIKYPVALDNQFDTWRAFRNNYWPAHYLIDSSGSIRRVHFGEGEYDKTEEAIRALLAEAGANVSLEMADTKQNQGSASNDQSPETYLGTRRASNYVGKPALGAGENVITQFDPKDELKKNEWMLGGNWNVGEDSMTAAGDSTLKFNFAGKHMFLVVGPTSGEDVAIEVLIDGKPADQTSSQGEDVVGSQLKISENKLYRIVSHDKFRPQTTVELRVSAGAELFSFTFGS